MKLASLLLALAAGLPVTAQPAVPTFPLLLITQRIDESRMTILRGNTHPLARPEFDRGTAPASLPMERMLLVLKRSAE